MRVNGLYFESSIYLQAAPCNIWWILKTSGLSTIKFELLEAVIPKNDLLGANSYHLSVAGLLEGIQESSLHGVRYCLWLGIWDIDTCELPRGNHLENLRDIEIIRVAIGGNKLSSCCLKDT